jgi:hypothetical protein
MKQRYGSYADGLYVVGAMMAFSAVLMLVLRGQIEHKSRKAEASQ